jgi:hypothetical protein
MYLGLHVKNSLLLSDYTECVFFKQVFKKYSNIKFHENPSIERDRHEEFCSLVFNFDNDAIKETT